MSVVREAPTVERICRYCGSGFAKNAATLRHEESRGIPTGVYCSRACHSAGRRDPAKRLTGTCVRCGTAFEWFASTPIPRKYCSKECAGTKAEHVAKSCQVCGAAYKVLPSKAATSRYCSWSCKYIGCGERQKKTENEAKARLQTKAWVRLRRLVIERDGFKCTECGAEKKLLHAHHVTPWRESRDDSLANLVTLCTSCHMKAEAQINRRHKYYARAEA